MGDRPQEIRKEHVYGNFRQRSLGKKRKNSGAHKKRAGMSETHLDCIRKMPCCVTLVMPCGEAHHLKSGTGERGMGLRSTDRRALPLAHDPHMELEGVGTKNEEQWFIDRGIDPLVLAEDLWKATGDVPRMIKVLMGHRAVMERSK